MLKLKKFFICLLTINIIFTTSVFAKNKDGSISTDGKTVYLKVWESDDDTQYDFIRQAGKEFTKLHPNIVITYIAHDFNNTVSDLIVDGPNGIGPDLYVAPHDKLGDLVTKKLCLPTENPENIQKNVISSCSKALTYDGVMYGYPLSAETYALFYNKNLIKDNEVPKTFEELEKWVSDFNKEHPDKKGFVMDFTNFYYAVIFTSLNGNRIFGETGLDKNSPNLNTKDAITGMKYFQKLRNSLGLKDITTTSSTCDGLFVSGNAAMHITGLWNISSFENSGVNFGVTTLPSLPGESHPVTSFSGTRGMFVSSYSTHPKEAAMFAEFLTTKEMQLLRYKLTEAMPSVSISTDSKYMDGFLKQLNYSTPMPSIPEMGKVWENQGTYLNNIWLGNDVETELNAFNGAIK